LIVTRTPIRISFFGGGTDLPAFYRDHGGAVLSTTINRYIYITVNRGFDSRIRVAYFAIRDGESGTEIVDHPSQIRHALIRESLLLTGVQGGLEITSTQEIPSLGSGLGSSSAYVVGLLKALHFLQCNRASAETVAQEACSIEIDRCKRPIGKQDQYIAAYGGLKRIEFQPDDTVVVSPIELSPELHDAFRKRLLLIYTGLVRHPNELLSKQVANIRETKSAIEPLTRIRDMVPQACEALRRGDLDAIGELLHNAWEEKRKVAAQISNPTLNDCYERARANGAIGGKILGAGGGGFFLFYAHPERHADILRALSELRHIPFDLEPQGSTVVYTNATHAL
jgi:D-glycero-alpha-D-manno-heptose-7-phosphate kinase